MYCRCQQPWAGCHIQLEQKAQEKLLRNGPMPKSQFVQLLRSLALTLKTKCDVDDIRFRHINLSEPIIAHNADKVIEKIKEHIELVEISTIVKEHGGEMSMTLFKSHLQMHQRLCSDIFIVSEGPQWFGRRRTALNIYDKKSLLRCVRTAGCAGVPLLALASEYQGCGADLLDFISMGTMVIVSLRVYCISVAQPKVEGALEAWNGSCRGSLPDLHN